ncbi:MULTISPECIES: carboxyl transferase domain-containing protein [Streptomyces]|uniref:Acetyl-coenzyme A carboxylase carboxyl transferase subunits beta/alpha n=1 Tax=Streptomyces rimosus subsp. rimosus (strain ATCC 10970 / DSM 40260 / JCM 4667 / NRRL 2234) TaxID=1265868 RepID=L8EF90_STRR1|nr:MULTISPECIES: carboxyl transferase domain-containing protein [Streptomyces]KOG69631.1 acetyl-CoA carboxylase [Kitasatospora aureofaciens]MYT42557.1 acetyl-CoA carboxylase [Streptomyces sp. SID5471]KEF08613.1 acetyl-CoA carboxylase [Streptomyces rimosus]KUJ40104.1 acetyl-CoA carboxylase [Streptomyces rimosus subsp. rimosus]QDA08328.1 acetyl-CoA carboxylase [Streptomyces rimosus]
MAVVTEDFTEFPAPEAEDAAPPTSAPEADDGPLGWDGYGAARQRARERTGERESVISGTARIDGVPTVLISFEFGFLGGSLGERTGDRLVAAYTRARELRLPVVSLIATGGSRMQEGMRALTQLQRVAAQSALTRAAGLAQIAVVRDPTTGGGWATLGAGADVVLALPGAQIGFAGSRVRPADADPYAYSAEGQLAAGQIDAIVPPDRLRTTLGRWLGLLGVGGGAVGPGAVGPGAVGRPAVPGPAASGPAGVAPPPPLPLHALGSSDLPASGWAAVCAARDERRPRAAAYLDAYFDWREEISGDRCGGTDTGIRCGFGRRDGRTTAFAAQCGTAVRPAGFRTAARLIRLADRLGIPVLTLVDTPGAANDPDAERAGAGAAIADVFAALASVRTPVTSLLIGEGGAGGALALAAPDALWATPDSYFSVIAPESAAAILKRDANAVRDTADQLRLRPQDLLDLGIIQGIVPPAPSE